MNNPRNVGVSSIHEIAQAADVNPNTLVRLARQVGFEGFEDFREVFRDAIRSGSATFPDRVRWLQAISKQGELGALCADMAAGALHNVEETFERLDPVQLERAAAAIWNSRKVFVLGVGVHNANIRNFAYLASTGMPDFHAIPQSGSVAVDDLAWATEQDTLIAITTKPYRTEVVSAVELAKRKGLCTIGISDSLASPIISGSDYGFMVAVDTPQFFPSSVSVIALMETLLSFVVALADPKIVERVDQYHLRRRELGMYLENNL